VVTPAKQRNNEKVRKFWLATEMKEAVREYCWRKRIKPSAYVRSIVLEIIEFPENFEDADVPPAGRNDISVWIEPEDWNKAVAVAASYGTNVGPMIRVAIDRDLREEGIPYHVSTINPRRERIPVRE
jgi:hypothetical protein